MTKCIVKACPIAQNANSKYPNIIMYDFPANLDCSSSPIPHITTLSTDLLSLLLTKLEKHIRKKSVQFCENPVLCLSGEGQRNSPGFCAKYSINTLMLQTKRF
ncbi:hypothetical protein XENTR_v10013927 [Xenopus tropicalis]|nr:hypothetical protein XENTR_v10013927 [Xenopus tropicalis]